MYQTQHVIENILRLIYYNAKNTLEFMKHYKNYWIIKVWLYQKINNKYFLKIEERKSYIQIENK